MVRRLQLPVILLLLLFVENSFGQVKQDENLTATAVKTMVQNKSFDFIAQYALTDEGDQRFLTPLWGLFITKDLVTAYLPYYYSFAFDTRNPEDRDLDYSFTKYNYTYKAAKNGYNIKITPTDAKYYQTLYLWVSTRGQATLSIKYTVHSVSFKGYIRRNRATDQQIAGGKIPAQ